MKILIVDDHPVLLEGIVAILRQLGPDSVFLSAPDAAAALTLLAEHPDIDILILDLVMPGMGGLAAIAHFAQARPELPVIVLSSSEDPQDAYNALKQGVLGYVPKSASPFTLLSAIRMALNGERYIPPLILNAANALAPAEPRVEMLKPPPLTERQIVVLQRLADGHANKVIAFDLGLSENTVKAHVTAIFKALNVINRTQAVAVARGLGLI
jgi:two-component system nitrate/nitrite response regulator NarL